MMTMIIEATFLWCCKCINNDALNHTRRRTNSMSLYTVYSIAAEISFTSYGLHSNMHQQKQLFTCIWLCELANMNSWLVDLLTISYEQGLRFQSGAQIANWVCDVQLLFLSISEFIRFWSIWTLAIELSRPKSSMRQNFHLSTEIIVLSKASKRWRNKMKRTRTKFSFFFKLKRRKTIESIFYFDYLFQLVDYYI